MSLLKLFKFIEQSWGGWNYRKLFEKEIKLLGCHKDEMGIDFGFCMVIRKISGQNLADL